MQNLANEINISCDLLCYTEMNEIVISKMCVMKSEVNQKKKKQLQLFM